MFHLLSKVHEGPTSLVYRGLKAGSEEPVILKFPRREPPTSRDLARLRTEFRKVGLSGTPRVNVDKRFSLGVSFRF